MTSALKTAFHQARELMSRACSPAETERLLHMAANSPPRGASQVEAVNAMALALTVSPEAKHGLLQLVDLTKEDREKVLELQAFERFRLPAFNAGYPHTTDELHDALSAVMCDLYPGVHESCIAGALMVGVKPGRFVLNGVASDGWVVNPFQIVRTMRETKDADRSMRLGER